MRLQGKTALVAGASRNIGKAIALAFAREGAELVLIGRTHGDELKQVADDCETLGAKALPVLGDLGRHQDVERMAQQRKTEDGTPIGHSDGSPLRRVGSPEEVANAALFLASDESSYVTRDGMICAGGRYM